MPIPAGPLPQPITIRANTGTTARPNTGTRTRPVSGTADPSLPGNVQ